MPLRSTERTALVPQVIEQLQAQITSGEWAVGSRIPPEPDLAAALGVGRNTLREAVLALVHAGLLERRQGSGTFVVGARELAGAVGRSPPHRRRPGRPGPGARSPRGGLGQRRGGRLRRRRRGTAPADRGGRAQ